jgi:hypothetical protein
MTATRTAYKRSNVAVVEERAVAGLAVLRASFDGNTLYILAGGGAENWRVVQRWGEGDQAGEEILLTDADRPTAQTYAAMALHCVTGWEPSGRFLHDRAAVLALFRPWYGRHAEQIRNRRGKLLAEESLHG